MRGGRLPVVGLCDARRTCRRANEGHAPIPQSAAAHSRQVFQVMLQQPPAPQDPPPPEPPDEPELPPMPPLFGPQTAAPASAPTADAAPFPNPRAPTPAPNRPPIASPQPAVPPAAVAPPIPFNAPLAAPEIAPANPPAMMLPRLACAPMRATWTAPSPPLTRFISLTVVFRTLMNLPGLTIVDADCETGAIYAIGSLSQRAASQAPLRFP